LQRVERLHTIPIHNGVTNDIVERLYESIMRTLDSTKYLEFIINTKHKAITPWHKENHP
jgi:hypothetical protein